MVQYKVGQQVCSPSPDMVQFDMTDAGGLLLIKMNRPTQKEKQAFRQKVSLRFVVVAEIIMILVRMGALQWMDAPYCRHRSLNLTSLDFPEDVEGFAIHAMLVDASTGVLVAQKLFSPDTATSRGLYAAIASQPVIPDYNRRVARIQNTYSTAALIRERACLFPSWRGAWAGQAS